MTNATPENPKILIGASIPRSGHHFLAHMMTGYFGRDLNYCETYTPTDCCRAVPCTKRGRYSLIYQKSHDRDFKLPADVAEALYLIQYRHPVPEALSDRELDMNDDLGRPSLNFRQSREGFLMWLAAKAVYYRKFHDKWMARRLSNAVYMDYVELAGRPFEMMKEIVTRATGGVDEDRLGAAVERAGGVRSGNRDEVFRPRVNTESAHFDPELLGQLEDFVLKRCPAYGFTRELNGTYEGSALHGMILLKDQTEPLPEGETKRLKVAAKMAPDHPDVMRRLAQRGLRDGRVKQSITRLEILIERHPFFGGAYELLFRACAETKTPVPESVLTGNALLACSNDAALLMQLGEAFSEKGYRVNAAAALSMAMTLEPSNEEARERLAAIPGARR